MSSVEPEVEAGPELHLTTAYDGTLSRLVGYVPSRIQRGVIEAGGMSRLLGGILVSAVRHPRGYWGDVFDDMYLTIRRSWLAILLSLFGFLIFFSILTVQFFDMVGATQLFPPLLFLQSSRSFTLWINSMVVAGVIGAALTSDVGARQVREELDAMKVMGIDPVRDLAVPRVLSIAFLTTLLAIPSLLITMVSMQAGAAYVAGMSASDFYAVVLSNVSAIDVAAVVGNSVFAGLLIGTVCCYKGFTASGGSIGLGRAVNQAVVISFVSVWVLQVAYAALLLGLFPDLGNFR